MQEGVREEGQPFGEVSIGGGSQRNRSTVDRELPHSLLLALLLRECSADKMTLRCYRVRGLLMRVDLSTCKRGKVKTGYVDSAPNKLKDKGRLEGWVLGQGDASTDSYCGGCSMVWIGMIGGQSSDVTMHGRPLSLLHSFFTLHSRAPLCRIPQPLDRSD